MIPENIIAYTAVFIQLIGVSFYIKDMLKGATKPNLVSWVIWALAPLIGSFLQLKGGAGLSILPVFMAGFNPLLVVIISLLIKKGFWKVTKFDIVCGIFSIFALILWIITENLAISVLFAILSDSLASLPTIIKSWKYPNTESSLAYGAGIVANILGLIIIKNWIFPIYSFGIYFIVINSIIIFSIYRNKIFPKKTIS